MKSEELSVDDRSEALFRSIFEQSPQSIQVFAPDGRTLRVNRAWEELWGVTLDQIGDYNILEDPQLVAKGVMPYIERGFAGEATAIPAVLYDPDETIPDITRHRDPGRWVRAFIYPVKDALGRISEVVLMHEEITERKRTVEQLHQQRKENQTILDSVPALIWYKDKENRHLRCNRLAAEFTGLPKEAIEGTSAWDLFPREQAERFYAEDLEVISSGEPKLGIIEEVKAQPGESRWHQTDKLPCRDQEGNITGVVIFSLDITERRLAEEEKAKLAAQIENERQHLSSIVASVPGVVWEAWGKPDAASQRIDFVSDYVETMLGYTIKEWLGTPNFWLTIVHPDDRERAARVVAEQFSSGRGGVNEFRWVDKDGQVLWVEAHASVMKDEGGHSVGMRGVTMNVTGRKRAEEERELLLAREQQLRSEAEMANRLKDEFLATLSHELRTPLTAILGWSEMLGDARLDPETSLHALEVIRHNTRLQAQMIEDLLDVSRIITGKLRLSVQPVDLSAIIRAAVDSVRPAAQAKSIRVQLLLDSPAGQVSGDPHRLQQVVWNLVSNAIKFTPKGGRVMVQLERVNSYVEITISDTGQGIAPEFLPYTFDRFRQADATTTRTHGGLGLGLAIVRQLVELHGGTVRVDSAGEGQGATFAISLPLMAVHGVADDQVRVHPQAITRSQFYRPPQLEGLHVLVVDDQADTRDMLQFVLAECGARVSTASSAAAALTAFTEETFDVLLCDIGMPEEDGYSLIAKVRALGKEHGGRTPAAALTAYAREEDRIRVLRSGFQIHVPKPISPSELVAVVANLADRTGQD